jgi:predicted RNase H-like HicB family nuclease
MKRTSRNSRRRASRQVLKAYDIVLVYDPEDRWWSAEVPALPGAYGQGRTSASARKSVISAVNDILALHAERGHRLHAVHRVRIERAGAA